MSAEEKAEVVLIILRRLLKWLALAVVSVVVVTSLFFGYLKLDNYLNYERHEKEVAISVAIDKKICPETIPLFVSIKNGSSKIVERVSFSIAATKRGYSTIVNDYTNYEVDKILKPGERVDYCYTILSKEYLPNSVKRAELRGEGLDVRVASRDVHFQLTK